jgi:hypothetical protein
MNGEMNATQQAQAILDEANELEAKRRLQRMHDRSKGPGTVPQSLTGRALRRAQRGRFSILNSHMRTWWKA